MDEYIEQITFRRCEFSTQFLSSVWKYAKVRARHSLNTRTYICIILAAFVSTFLSENMIRRIAALINVVEISVRTYYTYEKTDKIKELCYRMKVVMISHCGEKMRFASKGNLTLSESRRLERGDVDNKIKPDIFRRIKCGEKIAFELHDEKFESFGFKKCGDKWKLDLNLNLNLISK